jgi:hypothetical protein
VSLKSSVKTWILKREIRKAAEKAEREGGAVKKLWDWLTDPAAPGRKRGIAAALIVVAASLRAGHAALIAACQDGLTSRLCSVESIGPIASILEVLAAWLPTLSDGTTFAGAIMGLVGLLHARKKDAAKKVAAGLVLVGLLAAAPASAETSLLAASLAPREAPAAAFGPAVPVEKMADEFARDLVWLGLGLSADMLSTSWALKECPSCYEANPLGHDVEARVALKLGMASAIGGLQYKLRRGGHHGWARALRWVGAVVHGAATVNNGINAAKGK